MDAYIVENVALVMACVEMEGILKFIVLWKWIDTYIVEMWVALLMAGLEIQGILKSQGLMSMWHIYLCITHW